jgi:hypothetical protein
MFGAEIPGLVRVVLSFPTCIMQRRIIRCGLQHLGNLPRPQDATAIRWRPDAICCYAVGAYPSRPFVCIKQQTLNDIVFDNFYGPNTPLQGVFRC